MLFDADNLKELKETMEIGTYFEGVGEFLDEA